MSLVLPPYLPLLFIHCGSCLSLVPVPSLVNGRLILVYRALYTWCCLLLTPCNCVMSFIGS